MGIAPRLQFAKPLIHCRDRCLTGSKMVQNGLIGVKKPR
jgi:hypothetical protein